MSRLLWVEWRRFRTRRIVRVFIVIALLNIVISGVWVFFKSNRNLGAAEAARVAQVERCRESVGPVPTEGGLDPGGLRFCEDVGQSNDPRFHLTDLPRTFEGLSLVFVFAMWGLGASFIEHDPRRLQQRAPVLKRRSAAG